MTYIRFALALVFITPPPSALAADPGMPIQLPMRAGDVQLQGWSADGTRLVVTTRRGYDLGALGGVDYLHLHEVRDVASGALVDAYQGARGTDADAKHDISKWTTAHKAARASGWKVFKKGLVPGRRGLASKGGAWTIGAEVVSKPIKGTTFEVKPSKKLVKLRLATPYIRDDLSDDEDAEEPSITLRLFAQKKGASEKVTLGRVRVPKQFMRDACGGNMDSTSAGGVAARWAPGERHAFVQVWLQQDTHNDECPGNTWSAYWITPVPPLAE